MKTSSMLCILGLLTLLGGLLSASDQKEAQSPEVNSVIIVAKGKDWKLNELNQKVLRYLWDNGSMPKGLELKCSVLVYQEDEKRLCRFQYYQGLGRRSWTVDIDHKGDVLKFESHIGIEAPHKNLDEY